MKKYIKDGWVERLRSGDYPQGRGFLQRDGEFCCLGVLSDMAVQEGVIEELFTASTGETYYSDGVIKTSQYLLSTVAEWAGLPDVLVPGCRRMTVVTATLSKDLMLPGEAEKVAFAGKHDLTEDNDYHPDDRNEWFTFSDLAEMIEHGIPVTP